MKGKTVRTGRSKGEGIITRAGAEAAAAMTPHKPLAGGNIFFMDDKEITIGEKKTLAQDTWRESQKTYGVLKNVQWSDLPMDLLMLVTERLTPADHVRMSITCKSWQCTAPSFLFSKIPVLLFIKNHTSNFFDPISKKKCVTYIPELLDATFHYSKGGWLLLSRKTNQSQFFFFNPLTNEKINLPNFYPTTSYKYGCKPGAFVVSFSSPPTSQDCVVLLILAMTFHSLYTENPCYFYGYHTCSHRDTTWEWKRNTELYSDLFKDLFQCQPACYKNQLYFNGLFFYLNTVGTLAIISLSKRTTWIQTIEKPRLMSSCKHYDCYLVESQGEILSIFCCDDQTRVFQLDRSVASKGLLVENWIKLESLQDNMLYLDRLISLSTVVKGKGNMIYFPTFERGCNDLEEPERRIWIDLNCIEDQVRRITP